ncbi:TagK domain-containing protein [Xylophilus sp. GOD-11R]|uniref:TagK domain-containing protein n=1 Tax=Xylophilus sp. GOD-11R TaxID=3089814 RepID=UPI00298CAEAF|nr:TagK domain-containing protein [Xylophilus sp. GOD-11R]WPB55354.1 TagK domain-containing protein [Xylophilus sp. GOD-11R]
MRTPARNVGGQPPAGADLRDEAGPPLPMLQALGIRDASEYGEWRAGSLTGDPFIDELHARYHALLSDPNALATPVVPQADGRVAPAGLAVRDGLAAQAGDAHGPQSLHDWLVASPSMDRLLAASETLAHDPLLDEPPADDVLRLFAPAPERQNARPSSLASLTRREHHLPAADSALRLPGVAAADAHGDKA